MYLHLGGDVVVAERDVLAILDGRAAAGSEINQEFIQRAHRGQQVPVPVVRGPGALGGRSWVVTTDGVYRSALSPATLAQRMSHFTNTRRRGGAKHQAGRGVLAFDAPLPT